MKRNLLLLPLCLCGLLLLSLASSAQSTGDYVPCQEMPNLILNYTADYRALMRFYTPMINRTPTPAANAAGGNANAAGGGANAATPAGGNRNAAATPNGGNAVNRDTTRGRTAANGRDTTARGSRDTTGGRTAATQQVQAPRGGANGAAVDGIGSPERREKLMALYTDYLSRLEKLNFNSLSEECKADYILFKRDMNEKLRTSAKEGAEFEKVKAWFPFLPNIYATEKLRSRGHQLDADKLAKEYSDITKQIKALEEKLKTERGLTLESVTEAMGVIANLKLSVQSVSDFYTGYDPLFTWAIPGPYKALEDELTAYSAAFKAKTPVVRTDKSGIAGIPAGRDELVKQLQFEMIPYTPEELIDIANKEFAWCDKEMLKAAKDMGFGNDWKAALEKVKNSYVAPGKQPEMILGLYNESLAFLKKHDLITIPAIADETWGMEMMSPERQLTSPFFLGGTNLDISYPTNTMNEDDRLMSMRGNNPHFSRATVHHELIAGHTLEYYMQQRYRTYRDYPSGFWSEGWSLYWELLLWDKKFPASPEDRVGMLFWHMHRCARIIFSLNYHLGKWTPQECIDFLVDRVGHEKANAEGEVRRSFNGSYPPLYQLSYLTGGRQFYALRQELVVKQHKMTEKQFHDTIMHLNAMPIEMIRAIMTNQPLDKDFKTKWRFYDDIDLSKSDW